MSIRIASRWRRVEEAIPLLLGFFLPAAFYWRSGDFSAIKDATWQLGVAALACAWLFKSLERGRLELPRKALPLLLPALALLAWTAARYLAAPYKTAAWPSFLEQVLGPCLYCLAVLELGGLETARRWTSWAVAGAWFCGAFGLAQRFGFRSCTPWMNAADPISSAFGGPDLFALFLAFMLPLVLTRLLDPERGAAAKASDVALLVLLEADLVLSGSFSGLAAFCVQSAMFALVAAAALPRSARRVAALALLAAAAAVFAAARFGGGRFQENGALALDNARHAWAPARAMAQERPWIGFGPGGYPIYFPQKIPRRQLAYRPLTAYPFHHPGSWLLETAAELGGAGVALWLWLFAALLAAAARSLPRRRAAGDLAGGVYTAGLAAAVLGELLCAQFIPLYENTALRGLLWLAAGLLGALSWQAAEAGWVHVLPLPWTEARRRLLYAPALALLGLMAVFSARWFLSDVEDNAAFAAAVLRFDYPGALALYQRVEAGTPDYVEDQDMIGLLRNFEKRYDAALRAFARVEDLEPNHPGHFVEMGEAYAGIGDWSDAIRCYGFDLEQDPYSVRAYDDLARASQAAGDLAAAKRAAFTEIGLEPTVPDHWTLLAELYVQQRRLADARKARSTAVRLEREQTTPGG